MRLLRYFASLSRGKTVLWCYLVWYVANVARFFDPSPAIWLNSLGISAVIGFALLLSVGGVAARPDRWQVFRLFAMPFCVSSFSSLIKGRGFVLVFPPGGVDLLVPVAACLAFLAMVAVLRAWVGQPASATGASGLAHNRRSSPRPTPEPTPGRTPRVDPSPPARPTYVQRWPRR